MLSTLPARVPARGHPAPAVPRRSRVPAHPTGHPRQSNTTTTSVARDSQIDAPARQTLFCGAEQPFTAGYLNQTSPALDSLAVSSPLGNQNSSPREQLAPKTNGCGTQIHASASPDGSSVWLAGTRGVSDTVIPLEARYIPREAISHLDGAQREACGCETQFIGCAVCGNPLGSQLTPCAAHASSGGFNLTFLASAVSPPLPPAEPSLRERVRARHNYAPDGRRIPRAPPPLPPLPARVPASNATTDAERRLRARILAQPNVYAETSYDDPSAIFTDDDWIPAPPTANALGPLPTGLFRHDATPPVLPFDADANAPWQLPWAQTRAQAEAIQAQAETQIDAQERQAQRLRAARLQSIQAYAETQIQTQAQLVQTLREQQEQQAQRWEQLVAAQTQRNMPELRRRIGGLEEGSTTRVLRVGRNAAASPTTVGTAAGGGGGGVGGGGEVGVGRAGTRIRARVAWSPDSDEEDEYVARELRRMARGL
ncbi:hypothetical protein C8R46DRAFT_1349440 [Mycena filopes]|nr:hypothetical protein C8R46DRAFT_1349440 [Mycena filopes]